MNFCPILIASSLSFYIVDYFDFLSFLYLFLPQMEEAGFLGNLDKTKHVFILYNR